MDDPNLLPAPVLVDPPNCACRGLSPQMREHTATSCGVFTTDELNDFTTMLQEESNANS